MEQLSSARASEEPSRIVDAVLFDLHNTTLDGDYAAVGLAHVADLMARRWAIEPADVGPAFGRGVHAAMRSYIDRDFYLMHDVFLDAFRHVADELGIDADDDELAELDREMWRANIPAARPTEGAIETMRALRDLGVKVGIAHVGDLMARRWAIEPADVGPAFGRGVHAAMRSYIDRDFYLMHDVFLDAFRHVADELGIDADDDELAELDREMWRANIPAARPAEGAIETMRALRDLGVKVGIVSWADTDVFDGLIEQLGFADHVDVALCSEDVRSCKPHPGIFRAALGALDTTPDRAIFVGDSIDGDIVGGNRLGMVTALVAAGEYSSDIDAFGDDPVTVPDHRLTSLPDIVDVVLALQRPGH